MTSITSLRQGGREDHIVEQTTLRQAVEAFEATLIREALRTCQTVSAAARVLGVTRSSMYRRMAKYGIPGARAKALMR